MLQPLAGYVEHGFYSFSPTFYEDFYKANGFEIKDIAIEFIINPLCGKKSM